MQAAASPRNSFLLYSQKPFSRADRIVSAISSRSGPERYSSASRMRIHSRLACPIAQFFWSAFEMNSLVKTLAPYSPAIRSVPSSLIESTTITSPTPRALSRHLPRLSSSFRVVTIRDILASSVSVLILHRRSQISLLRGPHRSLSSACTCWDCIPFPCTLRHIPAPSREPCVFHSSDPISADLSARTV